MDFNLDENLWNQLTELLSSFGISFFIALCILIIGRQAIKIIIKIISSALERSNTEDTVRIFVTNLLNTLLMIVVFIAAINQLGIQTTSIIAVLGAAGLAIGLALQGSLSNFAAGILIVIYRPYKVGDYIQADNHLGTVDDIQIFSTVLRTPDNKIVVVPNGSIMNGSIVNVATIALGKICLYIILKFETPSALAALTYSKFLARKNSALTTPTKAVQENKDIKTTNSQKFICKIAATIIMIYRDGVAPQTSIIL